MTNEPTEAPGERALTKEEQKRLRQEAETPPDFFEAVCGRFGPRDIDVCATEANRKCTCYLGPQDDGLTHRWFYEQTCERHAWCNPPFRDVRPWLAKAHAETQALPGSTALVLVPSDSSTNWWEAYTPLAFVLLLKPRIQFIAPPGLTYSTNSGKQALFVFGTGVQNIIQNWTWK